SYDQTATAMKSLDVAALDASNRVELEGLERAVGRYVARGFELVIGFTGIPDTLHHAFWAFHDPRSPLHDPAAPPALRTVIERAYVEIDGGIGRPWLKRRLPERLGRSLRALRKATGAIAWERTRAYAVPIHYPVSGVWVNLAGRQPKGTVAPGEDYERLRRTLARELAALRD